MDNFTNIQQILEGCLLGDGCLEMGANSKNACLSYGTSSEQHAKFVHSFFKNFCNDNYKNIKKDEYFDVRTNKTYVRYWFRTKCLSVFTEAYHRFYKNKIKIVPTDLSINNNTMLFWYIGDGELESKGGFIKLHTNSFKYKEVILLCNLLKRFEAKPLKKTENQFLVTIPRKKVKEFLSFIGDCPFKDYSHKWSFVDYKNKNIELNGMNNYSDKYPKVLKEFERGTYNIYQLHKKYNIPIKCIKNFFDTNGVVWEPVNKSRPVIQCDLNGKEFKTWPSATEASKSGKYDTSAILACCKGNRKTHKKYIWKFKK